MKASTTIASVLVLAAIAPAVADEHEQEEAADPEEKVCINTNLVKNFDALTDDHVYVEERARQGYLLTMKNRCHGLRFSQVIAFKDTTSRICSNGFGEILYNDRSIGRLQCRIGTIEPVENKDEARAIIDERLQFEEEMEKQKKAEKKKKKEMKKAAKEAEEV